MNLDRFRREPEKTFLRSYLHTGEPRIVESK